MLPMVVLLVVESEPRTSVLVLIIISGSAGFKSTARTTNTSWSRGFNCKSTCDSVKVFAADSDMLLEIVITSLVFFRAMVDRIGRPLLLLLKIENKICRKWVRTCSSQTLYWRNDRTCRLERSNGRLPMTESWGFPRRCTGENEKEDEKCQKRSKKRSRSSASSP